MSKSDARMLFILGQQKVVEPTTAADLAEAEQYFIQAYTADSGFYRALGWRGYTLVRKFEDGHADADVLDEAIALTEEALEGAPEDYDNHWAHAIARLFRREWEASDASYQQAMSLDIEGNIHLICDYSDALIYFGDNRTALRYARKAKGFRDWHKWNTAWAYFFLARTEFEICQDSNYFDLAIDEIKSMVLPPHHSRYLADAQLLVAAIHSLRGDNDKAAEAMQIYTAANGSSWTIDEEMERAPFDDNNEEAAKNRDFWQTAAGRALAISHT